MDIREVANLVFAKPIYSYTRFWQMIGRGTRLLDPSNLKPWCTKKDKFLILDCWDNFEYFKLQPQGKDLTSNTPLPVTLFDLRAQKIATAIETNPDIATKKIAKLQEFIASFPANSITIKEAKNDLDKLDNNFWKDITKEKISFLDAYIKPLAKRVS